MPHGVLSELVKLISRQWTRGYEILGPAVTTAGLAIVSISVTKMLVSTAARAAILYAQEGAVPWMWAALWGTAFQMVVLPVRWAMKCGEQHGRVVTYLMESSVGSVELLEAGGGHAAFN